MVQYKPLANVNRYVGGHGGVIDVQRQGHFMGAWYNIQEGATQVGAEAILNAIVDTFEMHGAVANHEPWTNKPATREWKAPETQPLVGLTETLAKAIHDKIEIRKEVDVPGTRPGKAGRIPDPIGENVYREPKMISRGENAKQIMVTTRVPIKASTRFVGIFDKSIHPGTKDRDDPQTVAQMFALMEFGSRDGHIPAFGLFSRAMDLATERTLDVTELAMKLAAAAVIAQLSRDAQKELEMHLVQQKTINRKSISSGNQVTEGRYNNATGARDAYWGKNQHTIKQRVLRLNTDATALDRELRDVISRDVHLDPNGKARMISELNRMTNSMSQSKIRAIPPSKTGFKKR